MEGFCRKVGTNRERAWALAKEDALAYQDNGRGEAKAADIRGASSRNEVSNSLANKIVSPLK